MNPNNCNTCSHRKDTDGGWCYMFRNEPTDVCLQHSLRRSVLQFHSGPIQQIVAIDMEAAERLIIAFREKYPDLVMSLEKLSGEYTRLSEALPSLADSIKAFQSKLPREDKNVRHSSKTGATWPKPKGSY